jgi:hypothetical protein
MTTTTVLLNETCCSYDHDSTTLSVGNVQLDFDRMLIDPNYIESRQIPGLSAIIKYALSVLPFIDVGIYLIYTNLSETCSTNLLSGASTTTKEFDELFSFRHLLLRTLF